MKMQIENTNKFVCRRRPFPREVGAPMKIRNLTGVLVQVQQGPDKGDYPPEANVVLESVPFGVPKDLPPPEPETRLIVRLTVGEACPDRDDLVVAIGSERGTLALIPVEHASPALAHLKSLMRSGDELWTVLLHEALVHALSATSSGKRPAFGEEHGAAQTILRKHAKALRAVVQLRAHGSVHSWTREQLATCMDFVLGGLVAGVVDADKDLHGHAADYILQRFAVIARGSL